MTTETGQTTRLPMSRRGWQNLLSHLEIRPSKGMGQNFLFDRDVVRRIVDAAGINAHSVVIEVGPGLGVLTEGLISRAGKVFAIELDRRLAAHLRNLFDDCPNFEVVEADAIEVELDTIVPEGVKFDVVANLPYSAAAAITRNLLEDPRPPSTLTLMVQKEVAERMAASPPDMSILAVAVQFYAHAEIAFVVPPDVFVPQPKVDSAVVRLVVRDKLPLPREETGDFFRMVNAGFRQKRKQVANSLAAELKIEKSAAAEALAAAGIEPSRRAETIDVDEWVQLTGTLRPLITAL